MTPTQHPTSPETVVDDLAKWNLEGYHAQPLLEFMRLMRGGGNFSLILLQYNDLRYRDKVIPFLNRYASNPTILHIDTETDFASFEKNLFSIAEAGHDLIHVTGLNEWLLEDREAKFRGFNYHRELIAGKVKISLALWMTEHDIRDFALKAPDMWAWRKGVLDFSVLERDRDLLELSALDVKRADLSQRRERIKEIEAWLSEHSEETISRANLLRELGHIRFELGDNNGSLQALEKAKKIYQHEKYKRDYAAVVDDIATVFRRKGDIETALRLHNETLEIFKDLGDQHSQGGALKGIARIYDDMGMWEKALELYQQAGSIFENVNDDVARAVIIGNTAQVYLDRGYPDKALPLLQESLKIFNSSGAKNEYAKVLGLVARIYNEKGDQEKAQRLLEEALEVFDSVGNKRSWAVALGDIARLFARRGDVEKALRLHTERLAVFEEQGDASETAHTLWSIASVHLSKGDYKTALPLLRRSYEIYRKLGRKHAISVVGADLGQVLCRIGDKREGVKMLRQSEEGLRKLGKDDQAVLLKRVIKDLQHPTKKKVTR